MLKMLLILMLLLPFTVSAFGFFGSGNGGFQFHFDDDGSDDPFSRGGRSSQKQPPPEPAKPLCSPNMYACPSDRWASAYYNKNSRGEVKCVKDPRDCPCQVPGEKKCTVGSWYMCVKQGASCPSQ